MPLNGYQHITARAHLSALVVSIKDANLRETPACNALREELLAAIDSANADKLVLDLSSVEFISSYGLLVFLAARRRMEGGIVILCGMSENIRGVFSICGLLSRDSTKVGPFEEASSVQSALESC
jgi:stage II sporulation protein AA (anti-sigma F factor antagonist)